MAVQTLFETLSLSVRLEQQEVSSPVVLCPSPLPSCRPRTAGALSGKMFGGGVECQCTSPNAL